MAVLRPAILNMFRGTYSADLVYGGLAWARQNGFKTPATVIRYLKILPVPSGEPDFSRFGGKDGKTVVLGPLATVKKWFSRGCSG
jgi:hypothetical protein